MTNSTIMSRRACVERITILPDGSIPQVEMTSLGFEESLNPFHPTPAEYACVLKGGCFITERNLFERPITDIRPGAVIGFKYYDFGEDFTNTSMEIALKCRGLGGKATVRVYADSPGDGLELGAVAVDSHDGVYRATLPCLTGRHAIFFVVEHGYSIYEGWDWAVKPMETRPLFELDSFVFVK
jgi:hypothetical protein